MVVGRGRRVVVGLGRRVVVVAGSMVVGRRVVVVGARVTIEVTIEVTVTVRTCSPWPALATNAPSRNPTTPNTQPWRHHGGLPLGGCSGGGAPQPPGGSCPQPPAGGIDSVGRSIATPRIPCCPSVHTPQENDPGQGPLRGHPTARRWAAHRRSAVDNRWIRGLALNSEGLALDGSCENDQSGCVLRELGNLPLITMLGYT